MKHCLSIYKNIDIICITETHFNKNILDSELSINGYRFFRKDRNFDIHDVGIDNLKDEISGGGGSIIYFKDTLDVTLVQSFYNKAPDSLAIEIDSSIGKFCIACVYRSPNLNDLLNSVLLSCIKDICNESNAFETALIGDLNLPDISYSVMELIEEGIPVDILFFDFKKAFDRVPHNRLILKLQCLGINGKVLDVIKDFLIGRTFRVSVQGEFSSFKDILSGIPQGSVLGPLLFILFINDLPDCLKSSVKIFADDLKLIANLSDKTVIDNDLKSLEDWERKWLLEFNSDKCKVLHIDLNDNEHQDYVLNGKKLKKTEQEKDLGVLTSGTLLWNDQIESCISKANQMLCWISRNLISREKSLMLRVYKTLIRPHLEYCVQLWNPAAEHGNWSLILRIESVQRRFTRMIEEVGLLPYSERLRILQLTTLAERRSRGDLIEVYKANKGFSQLAGVLNFSRSGSNLICKPGKSKSAKITRIRRNFINERVMLSWNKLPSDVKNSDSLDIFKRNLEMFKSKTRALGISGCGNYWEISDEVLNRIEAGNYLENKMRHNEYLKDNPLAARKKFINLN